MKKPFVVGMCGIDGSGKSTQLEMLRDSLLEMGYKVKTTKVPMQRTRVLFDVSEKLFGDPYAYHPHIPPELMNTVIACDASYHYLYSCNDFSDYDIILCDRHKLCYLAYSDAFGGDIKWVEEILALIEEPDIILYIDTPVDMAVNRINNRVDKPLRTDENPEILAEVSKAYKRRIKELLNVIVIDGTREKNEVHQEILSIMEHNIQNI